MMIGAHQRGPGVEPRPALWKLAAAFLIVYLGYGLNFLAVKVGVETLPAFLFAGTHIFLAGVLIAGWRAAAGHAGIPSLLTVRRAAIAAFFLFVGGVGLVTEGEKLGVPSGVAAIIKASVPLWVAVIESARPGGEKPNLPMVAGLALGALGVAVLVVPRLSGGSAGGLGTALLLLSALLFACGTVLVRHRPPSGSTSEGVCLMMVIGGLYLLVGGTLSGEWREISAGDFGPRAWMALGFLLIVHSLGAFTAMNWLLRYLSAAAVTTKFYVSPAIAVLAGWLVLGESVHFLTLGSLGLILAGVGGVLWGESRKHAEPALKADDPDELEA